jgi:SAM-dependent methyltransferase
MDWRQPSHIQANACEPMNLNLFQCIRCAGRLEKRDPGALRCSACGARVDSTDDILDFVAGKAVTALDELDYDQFYRIDDDYSHLLIREIQSSVGDRWPKTIGTVVELGCGTGGFSRALLQVERPQAAVLTDVSPKMLRICRQHLSRIGVLLQGEITFATYSGAERSLATEAFDICVGTSVLHHILDVRACLADVHRILKPGGRAFFLEPNYRFHHALHATLADLVALYLTQGVPPGDPDLSRISNWVCEFRCNALHSGDLAFLATREDKHMFTSEEVRALARETGFAAGEALPVSIDPTGKNTADVYLAQCEVSVERRRELNRLMPALRDRYFDLLSVADQSPSYVLAFEKSADACKAQPVGPRDKSAPPTPPRSLTDLRLRACIDLSAVRTEAGIEITIRGWCVAITGVRWVHLKVAGQTHRVPVWLPRIDVQAAINAGGLYPSWVALCSGLQETVLLPHGAAVEPLLIDIVSTDASVFTFECPESLGSAGTAALRVNV